MRQDVALAVLGFLIFSGCKKEAPPPPPPQVQQVAPQEQKTVEPGMEAENPAEKEGQP